jgi:hypothetical protein
MTYEQPDGSVQYHFRHAVGGFFDCSTTLARSLLPVDLQPVELRHGTSVLSVLAFHFDGSPVGPYDEVVLSIVVSPYIEPGRDLPKSAFFPVVVATSTRESRDHAIERWQLPHYMEPIKVQWKEQPGRVDVHVAGPPGKMFDLSITDYEWSEVEHRYQTFMQTQDGLRTSDVLLEGRFSDNEEERGRVTFYQPGIKSLLNIGDPGDIGTVPFRELWMKDGLETFCPLRGLSLMPTR